MSDFHATNKPDTCLWCGKRLPAARNGRRGYYGNGFFCTLSCGYLFAVTAARDGTRMKPKESELPNQSHRDTWFSFRVLRRLVC